MLTPEIEKAIKHIRDRDLDGFRITNDARHLAAALDAADAENAELKKTLDYKHVQVAESIVVRLDLERKNMELAVKVRAEQDRNQRNLDLVLDLTKQNNELTAKLDEAEQVMKHLETAEREMQNSLDGLAGMVKLLEVEAKEPSKGLEELRAIYDNIGIGRLSYLGKSIKDVFGLLYRVRCGEFHGREQQEPSEKLRPRVKELEELAKEARIAELETQLAELRGMLKETAPYVFNCEPMVGTYRSDKELVERLEAVLAKKA